MKLSLKSQIATAATLLVIGTSTYAAPIVTGSVSVSRDNTGIMTAHTSDYKIDPAVPYRALAETVWSASKATVDAFNTAANALNATSDLTPYYNTTKTFAGALDTASSNIGNTVDTGNTALNKYASAQNLTARTLVDSTGMPLASNATQTYSSSYNATTDTWGTLNNITNTYVGTQGDWVVPTTPSNP